jgi:hypothetical protein
MSRTIPLALCSLLAIPSVARAHVTDAEGDTDFSFEAPYVIQGGPTASPLLPFVPNALAIMRSRAVFSHLGPGDYDVVKLTISSADCQKFGGYDQNGRPIFTPSPVVIAASALPMAFEEYKNFYPSIALVGPMLPAPTESLPFPLPAGMGVIVKHSPTITPPSARPGFTFSEAGQTGSLEWFLPQGLTQECLFNAPQTCDYSNTISEAVFIPQGMPARDYYIVIFHGSNARPGDVTFNIGFLEYLDQAGTIPIPMTLAEAPRHAATLAAALNCSLFMLPCNYVQ